MSSLAEISPPTGRTLATSQLQGTIFIILNKNYENVRIIPNQQITGH